MPNLFKKFYVGTLKNFNTADKDVNSLYLIQDEVTKIRSIYKGNVKVAGDFIIVNGTAPANPEQGVIYYISEFGKTNDKTGKPYVGFYNGTNWVALSDQATIETLDKRIEDVEGTIGTLNGGVDTDGSVAKQVADVKKAIEGTLKDGDAKTLEAINTELKGLKTKTSVKDGDKVLSQDDNGISSSMSINYDKGKKRIYLYGTAEDDAHKIGEIDTTEFVKDGMLSKAELKESDEDHQSVDGPYIVLTWNTDSGADPMWISVKSLVDVYTGAENEIDVSNNVISLADSTKDSLALADTAIQSVSTASDSQEVTVSTTDKAVTVGITKAIYATASDDKKTNGVFTKEGLVDSALLKAYIADEIAKNSVYWEEL